MSRTTLPLLVGEAFSPWTQKARWALDHCGVAFTYCEYTPTVSEPWLRWRMRQWSGPMSVPVLLAGAQALRGSWDIARHAALQAGDGRLGDVEAISPWNELSETALAEARTRVVRCVLSDPAALDESAAAVLPAPLRGPLRLVTRDAARRLARRLDGKYQHLLVPGSLRRALEHTRAGLRAAGSDHLLGHFSYADIAMAVVLEAVAPAAKIEPPLGPATRRCWSDDALAREFADLVQWRDRLLASRAGK
ncbi:glutathione S-transferase N-terminal domain-containing protein [Montanilutibacter psychrotolerans]|uniref:Glutathione S-transferase domain-containing protein n=1 Tax=Montanilutibacter psychrotolerans TaxID=1327343 RepID=A0A3M8T3Y2_9GAMM|nr:glutathione S-transferase N-terminal domain-containing protein [Lysobacter psychrotolerans]RNF85432.1 glutathione S-transferase domain-containing protein [Lysobacter psychrotolerans]